MNVPFLDLKSQYLSIKSEIDSAIQQVIEKTAFAGGPFVETFEKQFAVYCNCEHGIGVSSGTSALWLALLGLGIGAGDEVITTPNTFIATAEAISYAGATPVFVDIDETSYNIDPNLLAAAITPKTKAIIPVHLFGQMADMTAICEIAREHNLYVIEDASQAHGAMHRGKKAGEFGHAACFSFYPGKNLGAYGEAGGIVTNDGELAQKIKMYRDHGQSQKYYHEYVGWNGRMDGIQGAVLSVKLKHIDQWNDARRAHAKQYDALLAEIPAIVSPVEIPDAKHVYHIYAIRANNRDSIIEEMKARNVFCGIHYPVPLHLQNAYKYLGYTAGDFPVAERCSNEYISLPMFPELTDESVAHVAKLLMSIIK